MKHYILALLLFLFSRASSQTNDYQVTLGGIGPIKVDMAKKEVEKILNQTIKTPNGSGKEELGLDTVKVTWKETELEIIFYRKYIDEKKKEIAVFAVSGNSALLKTKSGIVVGDSKLKVIETYLDYSMNLYKDYEPDEKGDYTVSKTKSTVMLMGDSGNYVIYFKFENNLLVSFTVTINEGC